MSYTASTYEAAPGKVIIGGVTFLSLGNIREDIGINTQDYKPETAPTAMKFATGTQARITFRPDGRITLARLQLLFAAATKTLGGLMWSTGGCVIHNINGRKRTYAKAWIVPQISARVSTQETFVSSITIIAVKPDRATALYADTSVDYDGHAFDAAEVLRPSPTLTWGASPFDSFTPQNGIDFVLNADTTDVMNEAVGLVNHRVTGFSLSATLVPVGPTVAQVQAALGAASLNAGEFLPGPADFVLDATGLYIKMSNAVMTAAPLEHGSAVQTQGAVTFVSTPVQTTGAWDQALTINDNA